MCREANVRVTAKNTIPHRPTTLTFRNRISLPPPPSLSRNLQDSFEQKKTITEYLPKQRKNRVTANCFKRTS